MSKPVWIQAQEQAQYGIALLAYGESRCEDAAQHLREAARLAEAIYPAMVERHAIASAPTQPAVPDTRKEPS